MTYLLHVNGRALSRWLVTAGTFFRPPVTVRSSLVTIPGRHGAVPVGGVVFDEPQVQIVLTPNTITTGENLDLLMADLAALLAAPSLTLRRTAEGRVEEAAARLVSITPEETFKEGVFASVVAVLALPGVFFRDQATTDVAVAAGSSVNVAGLAGSGPIVDAILRWGPGAMAGAVTKALTDVATGTGVTIDYAPAASEYLYLRLPDLRAWSTTSSTAWAPAGTNRTALADHPGPGPLQLWPTLPASGARQLLVTASHAVTIRARRAWL